jgi:hypothetical protein
MDLASFESSLMGAINLLATDDDEDDEDDAGTMDDATESTRSRNSFSFPRDSNKNKRMQKKKTYPAFLITQTLARNGRFKALCLRF